MNIIKIQGISESYPESVEGTINWYYCKGDRNYICDLYEAEDIVKSKGTFPGVNCHLVHYPEGTVYTPFKLQENVYIERPIWDKGKFYFLRVDFSEEKIQIYSYIPVSEKLELIKELPLGIVEDCYNLMLEVSPLTLGRSTRDGIYEIVWPENKKIKIGNNEVLLFRDEDDLYFSEWYEDPDYHENIIIRDINTGKIKEKHSGYLCKMPNGVYWKI